MLRKKMEFANQQEKMQKAAERKANKEVDKE